MDRIFERLGYASQWLSDTLQHPAAAAAAGADRARDEMSDARDGAEDLFDRLTDHLPEGVSPEMVAAATSAAGAWLASRVLSPGSVRWSRAVIAGVVGTLLYDLVGRLDRSARGDMRMDDESGLRERIAGEFEDADWSAIGARYGAGVALALFYATYLNHRLPGPAPVRGAIFGGLDAAALRWGGILPLLQNLHPDLELPAGIGGLSPDVSPDPRAIARHLAFGAGVGLVYAD
jgi:hypothetical protein